MQQRRFVRDHDANLAGVGGREFQRDLPAAAVAENEHRIRAGDGRQLPMGVVGMDLDRLRFRRSGQRAAGIAPSVVGDHRGLVGQALGEVREQVGVVDAAAGHQQHWSRAADLVLQGRAGTRGWRLSSRSLASDRFLPCQVVGAARTFST